jgi:hypothetical protein
MFGSSKRIYLYRVPREEGLDDRVKGGHMPHITQHTFISNMSHTHTHLTLPIRRIYPLYLTLCHPSYTSVTHTIYTF